MPDFSSALYLGMLHASQDLKPWIRLTYGAPAALREPEFAQVLAQKVANLQGCEGGLLAPSTLHLFWDFFGLVAKGDTVIFVDSGTYPIGRWGMERAASLGTEKHTFQHYDPDSLSSLLRHVTGTGKRPIILSDGFCPGCGRVAPIKEYLKIAEKYRGLLILDDTQALGIYGSMPGPSNPYGIGGGGSLRRSGIGSHPSVVLISSLAKAFGAPLAILSGPKRIVEQFSGKSKTRIHCGPPSMASINAANHALEINKKIGDRLRRKLAFLVMRFKEGLKKQGLRTTAGLFPVRTLFFESGTDVLTLYNRLLRCGLRTVLHKRRQGVKACISFILRADQTVEDIDKAIHTLKECNISRIGGRDRALGKAAAPTYERSNILEWFV